MCEIPNNSKRDPGINNPSKTSGSRDGSEEFAHIKSANRKVRLLDILRHYGLKIEKDYQRSNWSINIICPLPNHKGGKERTASFAYNFVTDHFNCLGCNKSGRAVEFISLYERVTRTSVAERILSQYGEDVSTEDFEDYEDDISPILFEGSKHLQELIQKNKHNPEKLKRIDKYIYYLDFYIANIKVVTAEGLKYRMDRIKEFT
jgi:hypothetical protein